MAEKGGKIDGKIGGTPKFLAAQARASGMTQEAAARQAGCGVRSVSRWEETNDADYWSAFEECRRQLKQRGWAEAWLKIRALLRSEDERVALSAASRIITSVDDTEPKELRHTGQGGGPIQTEDVTTLRQALDEEQRRVRAESERESDDP